MYNKVVLIGRLARDPEYRLTPSGIPITRFTIAVDKIRKNVSPDQPTADFIRIVAWRRLAEICNEYLKKGRLVAIEGRLQIDSYEKDGEQRTSAEVTADNMQMLGRTTEETPSEIPVSMEG